MGTYAFVINSIRVAIGSTKELTTCITECKFINPSAYLIFFKCCDLFE
jgi:hypothetical protein